MILIDNIQPLWFFVSLFIGLFLVYIITPTPEVIVKYPTPENANESIFEDDSNNCYKFVTKEVDCPKDKEINEIPIQRKVEYFENKENFNKSS